MAERLSAFEDRIDALSSLEADLEALSEAVDSGFENFEDVLEHVLETTDELERRSTTLATAVLDLREQRDALAARERRRSEAERLQRAASRLGIQTATCAACSTAVSMGLLTEPTCPYCGTQFADVSKKRSFLGSHTLETGEPPPSNRQRTRRSTPTRRRRSSRRSRPTRNRRSTTNRPRARRKANE
ncbi:hypothetical protein ACFQMM_05320 [Saliphagus sp. GCM10025308]